MKSEWIITNKELRNTPAKLAKMEGYSVYHDENFKFYESGEIKVFIDGYVLLRSSFRDTVSYNSGEELISELYAKYGSGFTEKIKGNFIIIIAFRDSFQIYTDHLGMNKFFYHNTDGQFVISNSFGCVVKNCDVEISNENIALFSVMQHFYGGITLFKDVFHSAQAIEILFENNTLKIGNYWNVDQLKRGITSGEMLGLDDLHESNLQIAKDYLATFDNSKVSLTLTGGFDSRYILSLLLNAGADVSTISYGNPGAKDVLIAKQIANTLGFEHKNYFLEYDLPEYKKYAQLSVEKGEGLSHLHRAHRHYMTFSADISDKVLFTGHNGGESIRGITYNDYFDSGLLKDINNGIQIDENYLANKLKKYFINIESIDLSKLLESIGKLPFNTTDTKNNIFNFLYSNVASAHHFQDIFLYGHYTKGVVPFFLDVDFLENLFSSEYNLYKLDSLIQKQKFPKFYTSGIMKNYPELGEFRMNRNYSPKEYKSLGSFVYLLKKIRDRKDNNNTPNYSYKNWFNSFFEENLDQNSKFLFDVFDITHVRDKLQSGNHKSTEGYWLKYSNIIYLQTINSIFRG